MGVFNGLFTRQSPATTAGDLTVGGDLMVTGSLNATSDNDLNIVDSIIILNDGEAGAGVTTGTSGYQVDRGSETDFQAVFIEADDKFKAGLVGALKVVTLGDVGTAGYIPFGKTGGGELTEESNLFWDTSNNRLGLNNATPSVTLDVTGTGSFSGDVTLAADLINSGEFDIVSQVSDGASAIAFDFDTSNTLSTSGANLVKIRNNTTDRLTLDKDGALTVANAVTSSAGTSSLAAATITGDLTVDTNSLKVDSGNNRVGIGQASPTVGFEVAFDSLFTSTGYVQLPSGSTAQRPTPANGMIRYNSDDDKLESYEGGTWGYFGHATDHGGLAGLGDDDHTIYSLATGTRAFSGKVTIDAGGMDITGDVGIGTGSPDGTLHAMTASAGVITADADADDIVAENSGNAGISIISGNTSDGNLYFASDAGGSQGSIKYNQSSELMTFGTNGSAVAYLTSGGRLGIGTNAPDGPLHAFSATAGAVAATADADELILENSGNTGLTLLGSTTGTLNMAFGDSADADAGIIKYTNTASHANDTLAFTVGTTEFAYLTTSSRMGLGTNAPDGSLHVMSASAGTITAGADADEITIEGSGNSGMTILSGNGSTGSVYFGDDGDADQGTFKFVHTGDTNSFFFSTDGDSSSSFIIGDNRVACGNASGVDSSTTLTSTTSTTSDTAIAATSSVASSYTGSILSSTCNQVAGTGFSFLECKADVDGSPTTEFAVRGDGNVGIGKNATANRLALDLSTEDLEVMDAGTTGYTGGGTGVDWIEVSVGGNTRYIYCYDAK